MKAFWLSSSAIIASVISSAGVAQNAPATDSAPGDIVVTAQKRTERLQDVPVAVSVINGDALAKLATLNIEDTQRLVPSLTFLKGGTSLNSSLFLRGVGTINFSIAAEPSVSTVIDGVVLSRAGEGFGDLYEIDRIEVLRGPQGTLFGKNASAGVVNVITKQPGNKLRAFAEAGYFDRNEYKAKAGISGPLNETFKAGFTGFYGEYDGNIYNYTLKRYVNGYKHYGGRFQLVGDISPALKLAFAADYRKADDSCCAEVIGTTPTNATAAILPAPQGDATRGVIQNEVTATKETNYGGSMQADLSLGSHTLTSITAYRKWDNEEIRDGDWLDQSYVGVTQLHDDGPEKASTFTQELRLTSPKSGMVDYVLGGYYSHAKARRTFTRTDIVCSASTSAPIATGLTPCLSGSSTVTNPTGTANFGSVFDNLAAFGQATGHLGEHVRLITGLRFTHDKLSVDHIRVTTLSGPGINTSFDQGVYDTGVSNGIAWKASTSNNNLSGKAGLEYEFDRAHMGYATYSRGYKGPAFNVFFNMTKANTDPIAPETVDSYEIGLKNSFAQGRVVLNLAAYYAKYQNYQANNPTLVNGVVTTTLTNAGDVSTRGFEADWVIRLAQPLTITGGFSYSDAHIDHFNLPVGAAESSRIPDGTPLPFAPKTKGSLGVNYVVQPESAPFSLELGAQGSFQDKQLSALNASASVRQALTIPAYGQVDLSIAAVGPDKRYRLAFIVKNVFDEHYPAAITAGGPGGSYRYIIPRDADRYWGVTMRYNFSGK